MEKKLYCEQSNWERIKESYRKNAMLGRFYTYLKKQNRKGEGLS